jgi:hypothetical protein
VNLVHAAENLLELVVTRPVSGNALGPRARLSRGLRGGARRDRHRALQPHRLVQGARAARPGRLGAPLGPGANTCWPRASRRPYRPIRISPHRWEWARDTASTTAESGHRLWRFRSYQSLDIEPWCSKPSAPRQSLSSLDRLRHTFIPEWKWFSPTAGIGTAYQHIEDKQCPAPAEKPTTRWPTSRLGARGFITDDSCGAPIGATMSSSTV